MGLLAAATKLAGGLLAGRRKKKEPTVTPQEEVSSGLLGAVSRIKRSVEDDTVLRPSSTLQKTFDPEPVPPVLKQKRELRQPTSVKEALAQDPTLGVGLPLDAVRDRPTTIEEMQARHEELKAKGQTIGPATKKGLVGGTKTFLTKHLDEGLTGGTQGAEFEALSGRRAEDKHKGLLGFAAPFATRSGTEKAELLRDELLNTGSSFERADEIARALMTSKGPLAGMQSDKAMEKLALNEQEKRAINKRKFRQTAGNVLDVPFVGSLIPEGTIANKIAGSKAPNEILDLLKKAVPKIDDDVAKTSSVILSNMDNTDDVGKVLNRLEFKYQGKAAGASGGKKPKPTLTDEQLAVLESDFTGSAEPSKLKQVTDDIWSGKVDLKPPSASDATSAEWRESLGSGNFARIFGTKRGLLKNASGKTIKRKRVTLDPASDTRQTIGEYAEDAGLSEDELLNSLTDKTRNSRFKEGEFAPKSPKISEEGIPLALNARERAIVDSAAREHSGISTKAEGKIAAKAGEELPPLRNIEAPGQILSEKVSYTDNNTSLWAKFKRGLNPKSGLEPETKNIFQQWVRELSTGKVMGNSELGKFNIPNKQGMEIIHNYQAGKATPISGQIKQEFDQLYKEAVDRGLDVPYEKNYLPQVWKESPAQITKKITKKLKANGVSDTQIADYVSGKPLPNEVAKRLKLTPTFSKSKAFPDYKSGMSFGLTPKYTNPNQLLANYRVELEKAVANNKFIETLQQKGKVVSTPREGWKAINLQFSNKGLYAEPSLAKTLNGIFADAADRGFLDTIFSGTAKVSKFMQEVKLSAGVPFTDINFFSIGQLVKEITAGNIKSVIPFIRANFNKRSADWFVSNEKYIKMMAEEGIDLGSHVGSLDKAYENLAGKWYQKNVWGKLRWDKAFGEKTFASFIPQMHVQTFKDVYSKALKGGATASEAKKLASDVTKNAFGLIEDMGRSQATKDKLSAIFFAPRFREGIINTLMNTGRAGVDFVLKGGGSLGKLDPALTKNRKLLAGMMIGYAVYDGINKKLNGHHLYENPPGKKFALMIPRENGEVVYVEYMPSFLAFARNMVEGGLATSQGDIKLAQQKFGSVFSMPIKTTSEIIANKDYFGREIYKETDSSKTQIAKVAQYVGLAVNHPYVAEVIKQAQEDKPLHQSLTIALELPVKFSSKDKLNTQEYYNLSDQADKIKIENKKKFRPTYEAIRKLVDEDKRVEAQEKLNALTDKEYTLYKNMLSSDKRTKTFKAKRAFLPRYKEIRDLVDSGKEEEAQAMLNSLSEQDYKSYKALRKELITE